MFILFNLSIYYILILQWHYASHLRWFWDLICIFFHWTSLSSYFYVSHIHSDRYLQSLIITTVKHSSKELFCCGYSRDGTYSQWLGGDGTSICAMPQMATTFDKNLKLYPKTWIYIHTQQNIALICLFNYFSDVSMGANNNSNSSLSKYLLRNRLIYEIWYVLKLISETNLNYL